MHNYYADTDMHDTYSYCYISHLHSYVLLYIIAMVISSLNGTYVIKPAKIDHVSANYTELYFC